MTKNEYLLDVNIRAFVTWFAAELAQPKMRHSFVTARGKVFCFDGLTSALLQYEWPFSSKRRPAPRCSYAHNGATLDRLALDIKAALAAADTPALVQACIEVFIWGGVRAHNVEWVQAHSAILVEELQSVSLRLQRDEDTLATLQSIRRFNAGMTKVYALLLPAFIIYDSRVAAALAWFVAHWCCHTGKSVVPAALRFECMPPNEGTKARLRKLRNPSAGTLYFPELGNNYASHAHWNLRASWLLERTIELTAAQAFKSAHQPLRSLEAALFMWGYDLGPSVPKIPIQKPPGRRRLRMTLTNDPR